MEMEKYELIFKLPEFNVFLTDFLLRGYLELKPLVTIKNGKWASYSSEDTLKSLAEKGFGYALMEGFFEDFKNKSLVLVKNVLEFNNRNLENLGTKDFIAFMDEFLLASQAFLQEYRKTEYVYSTKIEKELGKFIEGKVSFQNLLSGRFDYSSFPEDKKRLTRYLISMQHFRLELRELFNKVLMGSDAIISRIIEQLSLRSGREDIINMTFDEAKQCLNGIKVEDVSERRVYSHLYWDNAWIISSGAEAYRKIRQLDDKLPKDEVIGVPACNGIAKGKVKVIPLSMNPEKHFSKFEKGDILVSDTTGPEMTVLIEKAGAIVADEGGMMSHAAVISREFGIPCVVGAKHATEVFKDGDLVEVNANSGVVRRVGDV